VSSCLPVWAGGSGSGRSRFPRAFQPAAPLHVVRCPPPGGQGPLGDGSTWPREAASPGRSWEPHRASTAQSLAALGPRLTSQERSQPLAGRTAGTSGPRLGLSWKAGLSGSSSTAQAPPSELEHARAAEIPAPRALLLSFPCEAEPTERHAAGQVPDLHDGGQGPCLAEFRSRVSLSGNGNVWVVGFTMGRGGTTGSETCLFTCST